LFKLQRFNPFNKILSTCKVYQEHSMNKVLFTNTNVVRVNIINVLGYCAEVEFVNDVSKKGWVDISAIE